MDAGSVLVGVSLGGVQGFVSGWGAVAAAAIQGTAKIAKSLAGMASETAAAGDHIQKMAQRLSWSTESLSEMDFALGQSGTSLADFENATRASLRALRDAKEGSSIAVKGFEQIGLSIADIQDLNPEQTFMAIVDGLKNIEDPSDRAGASMRLLGRSGMTMLPLVTADIKGLREEAQRLGNTFSQTEADASALFVDEMDRAEKATKGLWKELGVQLIPYVQTFFTLIGNHLPRITNWIKGNAAVATSMKWIGQRVGEVWDTFVLFSGFIATWTSTVFGAFVDAAKGVYLFVHELAHGLSVALVSPFKSMAQEAWIFIQDVRKMTSGMGGELFAKMLGIDPKTLNEQLDGMQKLVIATKAFAKDVEDSAVKTFEKTKTEANSSAEALKNSFSSGAGTLADWVIQFDQLKGDLIELPKYASDVDRALKGVNSSGQSTVSFLDAQFGKMQNSAQRRIKGMAGSFSSSFMQMKKDGASTGDAIGESIKQSIAGMAADEGQFHFLAGLAQMFSPGGHGAGAARMAKGIALMAFGATLGGGGGGASGDAGSVGEPETGGAGYEVPTEEEKSRKVLEIHPRGSDKLALAIELSSIMREFGEDYDIHVMAQGATA